MIAGISPEARARLHAAAVAILLMSLGFALGFIYAKNASTAPIVIEKRSQ